MFKDPYGLLLCHRHLLTQDFGPLGEGTSVHCKYWVVQMELALAAAARVRDGGMVPGRETRFCGSRLVDARVHPAPNGFMVYKGNIRQWGRLSDPRHILVAAIMIFFQLVKLDQLITPCSEYNVFTGRLIHDLWVGALLMGRHTPSHSTG